VIMATAGAILGGYLTYRMARKGGKETLEKRFSKRTTNRVYAIFSRWGFAAVAIPALLPPPFPIVPMLLAAGAMQYPTRKFLTALAVGRSIRFTILAYLGFHYGRHIVRLFALYYWPVLIALIAFSVLGALFGLFEYKRRQKANGPETSRTSLQPRRRGGLIALGLSSANPAGRNSTTVPRQRPRCDSFPCREPHLQQHS
jgi:membrane protein DedA with SNARE-associated domain